MMMIIVCMLNFHFFLLLSSICERVEAEATMKNIQIFQIHHEIIVIIYNENITSWFLYLDKE